MLADVGEGAVAIVVIEAIIFLWKAHGTAVHLNAFPVAGRIFAGLDRLIEIEDQVVRDEQIQMAVAVVIDPGAAGSKMSAGAKQARFFGDVGEGSVAVIVKKNILAPAGDKYVVETVVVIIANGNAAGPHAAGEAGFFSNVGEGSVAIILV